MIARDRQERIQERIAAVRRFNRFYTRQLGVLRKTYLDSAYSLGEARLLYEIAQRRSPIATEIVRALDLDAGYLSRVLQNFEKRGLIQRHPSTHDTRQSHVALSPAGRKAFTPLERRSQREAGATLEKLTAADQARLVAAMHTIQSLLDEQTEAKPPKTAQIKLREPVPGDFGWIVTRHAEIYAQEYGWVAPFEGVCAQIVADFVNDHDRKRERGWIAEVDGERVGTVMLVKDSEHVARIRLLLLEPQARGIGLGARLVDECIRLRAPRRLQENHTVDPQRAPRSAAHLPESGL